MNISRNISAIRHLVILGLIGLTFAAFASENSQDSSRLPGVSGADNALQRSVADMIWLLEYIESVREDAEAATCELAERRIINTEVLKLPEKPGRSDWIEKWTVDRCGEVVYYSIKFTPTPKKGGTDFKVSPMGKK